MSEPRTLPHSPHHRAPRPSTSSKSRSRGKKDRSKFGSVYSSTCSAPDIPEDTEMRGSEGDTTRIQQSFGQVWDSVASDASELIRTATKVDASRESGDALSDLSPAPAEPLPDVMEHRNKRSIVTSQQSSRFAVQRSVSASNFCHIQNTSHRILQSELARLGKTSACQRFIWVTIAIHPLFAFYKLSITRSRKTRTMLWLCKPCGGLMVSALWFNTAEDALSIDSPEVCEIRQVPLVRSILVGLASSVLSHGSVKLFGLMSTRDFTYCRDMGLNERRRLLLRYWALDKLSTLLGHVYIFFALWSVGLFLASVKDDTRAAFLMSYLTVTLQILLTPIGSAAILCIAAALVEHSARWVPPLAAEGVEIVPMKLSMVMWVVTELMYWIVPT